MLDSSSTLPLSALVAYTQNSYQTKHAGVTSPQQSTSIGSFAHTIINMMAGDTIKLLFILGHKRRVQAHKWFFPNLENNLIMRQPHNLMDMGRISVERKMLILVQGSSLSFALGDPALAFAIKLFSQSFNVPCNISPSLPEQPMFNRSHVCVLYFQSVNLISPDCILNFHLRVQGRYQLTNS